MDLNLLLYEISNLVIFIIFVAHCMKFRGKYDLARYFLIGALYGMILENSGVILGYYSEPGYMLYLPFSLVPLATMLGWTVVFYFSDHLSREISKLARLTQSVFTKAIMTTLIALSLDIQLDPVATAMGWWVWNPVLKDTFLGVPIINFVAWFYAVLPFALFIYLIESQTHWTERRKLIALVAAIPIMCVIEAVGVISTMTILSPAGLLDPPVWVVGIFESYQLWPF